MYKRIRSFIGCLCLCMGTIAGSRVYAAELQENAQEIFIVEDSGKADEQMNYDEDEVKIPQNGSEVHMEDVEEQAVTFSLRSSEQKPTTKQRYIVLVLDTSSSVGFRYNGSVIYTTDVALPYVKKASQKFVEDFKNAQGDNYIAIVAYGGDTSKVVSPFTKDAAALSKAINSLQEGGGSNIHSGITAAEELIDSVSDSGAATTVVVFTTGMSDTGEYSYTGHYNEFTVGGTWRVGSTGVNIYAYANSAYEAAEELKEKCTIYTVGLFQIFDGMPEQGRNIAKFCQLFTCDLATSKKHFYDVKNPNDLKFIFGQVAGNIINRTGTFSYAEANKDYTAQYYYKDDYFKTSSYEYNQNLATMSLCLDMSAFSSTEESDYTKKMKNAETLLSDLEFIGFDHNYTDFSEEGILGKPTKDSIGVVAANKVISDNGKDYTLIALAVRGGGYEREWASNFTIGESGEHEGFSKARDTVITFLEKYIKEQGISGDIKIWITGYSRGAATANMVAGALDKGAVDLGDCRLALEDMYAYTFETPAGVIDPEAKAPKYYNIHNIINGSDPVPKVAPRAWGFKRYGKDVYIGSKEEKGEKEYKEKVEIMKEKYKEMGGYKSYDVNDFVRIKIVHNPYYFLYGGAEYSIGFYRTSQEAFLDKYIEWLATSHLKDRTNYVANYQSGIQDACGIFFGTDPKTKDKLLDAMGKNFKEKLLSIVGDILQKKETEASELIAECMEKSLDQAGITNYNKDEFNEAVKKLSQLLINVVKDEPDMAATAMYNLSKIGQAHYPELCLAWMQTMDDNYTTDAKYGFTTGKYRVIRVNCPVDVMVYDAEGNVVAAIVNDTPQPDGDLVADYTSEGEKLVYVPIYHDYTVKLIATDNGVMSYAVQEYDPYAGGTSHMILFNDIEIADGQEYTTYLARYSEEQMESTTGAAADTEYTLFLGTEQILPSEELTGDAVNVYHDINAVSEDIEKGYVLGSGMHRYGLFAKVEAAAYEGYEFTGWYEGEDLVSTEAVYRFRVSEDTELMAKFKESSKEDIKEDPEKTPEQTSGKGVFKVTAQWSTGFNGEITLTNTTEEVIHNWTVAFDLPYEITNIWNGVIVSHENGVYTVKNVGYNGDIQLGESVTFGFGANAETDTITEPTGYTFIYAGE